MTTSSTSDAILDSAQNLAQKRGFNAFSYADIAVELGIRKASIHYHFPSKLDLEIALLDRYKVGFMSELEKIETSVVDAEQRLQKYAQLYASTLAQERICLAGMMASDINALSIELRDSLQSFFDAQVAWLAEVMSMGQNKGELRSGSAISQARAYLAALQGGLLISNATKDNVAFENMVQTMIINLQ